MNSELKRIQTRLDEYGSGLEEIVRLYGDEMSMSYFSDRFRPDHPQSAKADEGVRIQQLLIRMKSRLRSVADSFETEFPSLDVERS